MAIKIGLIYNNYLTYLLNHHKEYTRIPLITTRFREAQNTFSKGFAECYSRQSFADVFYRGLEQAFAMCKKKKKHSAKYFCRD